MSAEHPTPWAFNAVDEFEDTPILDSNGHSVLVRDSGYYPPDLDTCREIVEAVNEHAKMHEVAANLLRSRDAAIEDGERLRDLVRRMAQILQNIYDFTEALRAIIPVSSEQERTREAAQAVLATTIREARDSIGEGAQ